MQPFQLLLQLRLESLQSLPIHTSTASIRFHLFPGHLQVLPLPSPLSPTVSAGCLPRSTSDRRLLGHAAFTAFVVLHSRPSTGRASLAPSLALIGPLTLVPPRDSVSPPEVTRCSSVPCRPQSPWYDG